MASSSSSTTIHEGVFAINKPQGITSAQVIRDVQTHFNPSKLFAPWFERERAKQDAESHNQRRKRSSWKSKQAAQVKIGHGGTLDPLATGVLILGVGSGTKSLNKFLECTKSYETVLLFGAATDSYDTEGKIVARKPYQHVTRQLVEEKMELFKGKIMQRPPIFSAKRIQGKRLYEYAREGIPLPEGYKIEECPVEVQELEIMEWMDGGTHNYHWPDAEAAKEEKDVAEKVLNFGNRSSPKQANDGDEEDRVNIVVDRPAAVKRKREADETKGGAVKQADAPSPKRTKSFPDNMATVNAPTAATETQQAQDGAGMSFDHSLHKKSLLGTEPVTSAPLPANTATANDINGTQNAAGTSSDQPLPTTEVQCPTTYSSPCPAPAVRIRMTVTSGFYVRSLCHDLGAAVGSLGIMASLVRTRQADFALGTNTLWYEDLALGEEVWGPKIEEMLDSWKGQERRALEGGEAEVGREERVRRLEDSYHRKVGRDDGDGNEERKVEAKPAVRARMRRNTSSEED